jgi:hypothetical protein
MSPFCPGICHPWLLTMGIPGRIVFFHGPSTRACGNHSRSIELPVRRGPVACPRPVPGHTSLPGRWRPADAARPGTGARPPHRPPLGRSLPPGPQSDQPMRRCWLWSPSSPARGDRSVTPVSLRLRLWSPSSPARGDRSVNSGSQTTLEVSALPTYLGRASLGLADFREW